MDSLILKTYFLDNENTYIVRGDVTDISAKKMLLHSPGLSDRQPWGICRASRDRIRATL